MLRGVFGVARRFNIVQSRSKLRRSVKREWQQSASRFFVHGSRYRVSFERTSYWSLWTIYNINRTVLNARNDYRFFTKQEISIIKY